MTPKQYKRLRSKMKRDVVTNCWEWAGGLAGKGKGQPIVQIDKKKLYVRRLLLERQLGRKLQPEEGGVSCTCNNHLCVNPSHAVMTTPSQRTKAAADAGKLSTPIACMRRAAGSRQRGKVTQEQVREIRAGTGPLREDAARFGISRSMVSLIRRNAVRREYVTPFSGLGAANDSERRAA